MDRNYWDESYVPSIEDTIRKSVVTFDSVHDGSHVACPRLLGLFYTISKALQDNLETCSRALSDTVDVSKIYSPLDYFPKCCLPFCTRTFVRSLADVTLDLMHEFEDCENVSKLKLSCHAHHVISHWILFDKIPKIFENQKRAGKYPIPAPVDRYKKSPKETDYEYFANVLKLKKKLVEDLYSLPQDFFEKNPDDPMHPKLWFKMEESKPKISVAPGSKLSLKFDIKAAAPKRTTGSGIVISMPLKHSVNKEIRPIIPQKTYTFSTSAKPYIPE
ncbi:hypothetical protein ADUPG1_008624 [Aduncisulcus paluster]|uniref:Uncharacterized protein n=1 Tax=Aduncisulcus paluster TaxID=2918883 RepID=A0ABQ5KSN4_9EUKA|nr:hypothetical protein ADUPG1_008624 [Aduncisulcus paluster]